NGEFTSQRDLCGVCAAGECAAYRFERAFATDIESTNRRQDLSALIVTFGVLVAALLGVLLWSSGRKPRPEHSAPVQDSFFPPPSSSGSDTCSFGLSLGLACPVSPALADWPGW